MTISEQALREYHDGTRGLEVFDEDIAHQEAVGLVYSLSKLHYWRMDSGSVGMEPPPWKYDMDEQSERMNA